MQISAHFTRLLAFGLLLSTGCTLGPKAFRAERTKYNEALVQTHREELLLNLVRLRYRDSWNLLSVGSITSQRSYDETLGMTSSIPDGATKLLGLAGGMVRSERPTFSYTPATPDQVRGMLAPLTTETVYVMTHTGVGSDQVMRLIVERMNSVENAPTAGAAMPAMRPVFEDFNALLQHTRVLSANKQMEVGRIEKFIPVSDPIDRKSIAQGDYKDSFEKDFVYQPSADNPDKVVIAKRKEVTALRLSQEGQQTFEGQEVLRLLNLQPGLDTYELKPVMEQHLETDMDQVGGRTDIMVGLRSLQEILYFLSTGVDVPNEHIACGIASFTWDGNGNPFDWQQVLENTFRVRVCEKEPKSAPIRVHYRDHWFYIDDHDHETKATYLTMLKIVALQTRLGGGEAMPVLTIPIGGR